VAGFSFHWLSRTGYSGELGYEVYCRPEHAETIWQALLDQGAAYGIRAYGLAAVESLRIEAGLIFIGYDYFPGLTSPFHMNLDRTIKLDAGDFVGRDALRAELAAGITHRMVSLVIAGEEAPDYNTPVMRLGREVGRLLSPSAGRSPTVEKVIGMACVEAELTEIGTALEVTLPDGRSVPAMVESYPIYDPEKKRPRA
jgi:glycine cleavage system T protein (aminomethyltransferase)